MVPRGLNARETSRAWKVAARPGTSETLQDRDTHAPLSDRLPRGQRRRGHTGRELEPGQLDSASAVVNCLIDGDAIRLGLPGIGLMLRHDVVTAGDFDTSRPLAVDIPPQHAQIRHRMIQPPTGELPRRVLGSNEDGRFPGTARGQMQAQSTERLDAGLHFGHTEGPRQ